MGASKICTETHRTQSSLLLVCGDDGQQMTAGVFRAQQDSYPFATNFCDLPDLASSSDKKGANQKSFFTKLDKLNEIAQTMQYNEHIQFQQAKPKTVNVFTGLLSQFNDP